MKRPATAASSTVLLAGALLVLSACADGTDGTDTTGRSPAPAQTEAATPTTGETTAPVNPFGQKIAHLPQVDPAPYDSSRIFPQQPGFQFTGPDGTYCEVYGQPEGTVEEVTAMCTHSGEGDVNAVSVTPGQPATTPHVNRIFLPHEETQPLEPGTRLTVGAAACGVPEGEVAVTCSIDSHGFTVSTEDVETG